MNYEIKNKFIKAKINSLGAELNSLQRVDNNLEYLWQANPEYWNRNSPILFPIVGKLKNNSYVYKNKIYNMTQHGFARDREFIIEKQEKDFLEFKLLSDEMSLEIYPFEFEFFISYKLEKNRILVSYKVVNKSLEKMLFSIGAHPAFNWPLVNEKKEDCYLLFDELKNTQRIYLNKDGLVYNTEFSEVNENKINLKEELFENDALIFNNLNIKEITYKNNINDKFVKMNFEKFPYLGLWSKPTGAPFLCIEPWFGIADLQDSSGDFKKKKALISLPKDEVFKSIYSIEI